MTDCSHTKVVGTGLRCSRLDVTPAEAVLLAITCLERVKASSEVLQLLQQHGPADGQLAKSSAAAEGDGQQLPGQDAPALLPLLQRCGVLTGMVPLHDPAAVARLRRKAMTSLLAPAHDFRAYFGSAVGFHLALLNALATWLLAPAAVATYLLWALRSSSSSSSSSGSGQAVDAQGNALSSPLLPLLVCFHLLWSAAGLKLWARREAALRQAWRLDGSSSSNSSDGLAGPVAAGSGLDLAAGMSGGLGPGQGLSAASLEVAAAAGVRREYTGRWRINPFTHQLELFSSPAQQLLRLLASAAATALLLAAAAALLLLCLNLQGYIPPQQARLYWRSLAALCAPGGWFSKDSGAILSQVPLVVRSAVTILYTSNVYGPAAQLLTRLENHRTLEGFAACLTAKQAALQVLFTFGPVAYVGLAGAGAAAARSEVAALFKVELLRKAAMELLLQQTQ
ncbi:hypothetical protein OEZ85_001705 [Tetradesmus obliquus]|uniref:Anoctamin transmembrane domain-containing protein n=1 Tax=Tetradesmus obliquus TaxID=3088 RepID=A0ABY8U0S6_TETOB|nr:hypothetical protein OEZ85_001705 [Tetradesmus obliquus]